MFRLIVLLTAIAMPGCTQQSTPREQKPQQAGQPINPLAVAARMAALEAATVAGNQDEARRQAEGLQDGVRRSMKLANPSRRIDQEAARAVVKAMAGVRSVAWLDRENLLVMIEDDALRSQRTIDAICVGLEPLGDTLGVIVNLKTRAPKTHQERETTSRNCQLAPGDVALFQKVHPTYDPSPEIVAAFRASQRPQSDEDRKAQLEAQRILEATTPEM